MELNTQAMRGLQLIQTYAVIQVVPSAAMLLVLLLLTLVFPNPGNAVYSQLAAFGVTAVTGTLIVDRTFRDRMRPDDHVHEMPLRDICSLSAPMLMATSMSLAISHSGVIMLGMFRTESEVGHYAVAMKLATLTTFVIMAISAMTSPKFSELYHTDRIDEPFRVAKKSSKLIFWTTAPVLQVLAIAGKPILAYLFGKEFTVAYVAMFLLAIGQFVNSISGADFTFMTMTGHERVLGNIMFASAAVNVGLNLVLIPRLGIDGAAFSAMFALCMWNIAVLLYIKAKYGENIGYIPLPGAANSSIRRNLVKSGRVDVSAG